LIGITMEESATNKGETGPDAERLSLMSQMD